MKTTALSVVPAAQTTVAQRVLRLQEEARSLAQEHIRTLNVAIADAACIADEIAKGGDAYPAGIRDLARRFAEDADQRIQTLEALATRS